MNGTLRTVKGDVRSPQFLVSNELAIIPHVANNLKAWGAGFVMALNQKDDNPMRCYQNMFENRTIPKDKKDMLGLVSFASFCSTVGWQELNGFRLYDSKNAIFPSKMIVANMLAQDGYRGNSDFEVPLRYIALAKCMIKVALWIKKEADKYPDKLFAIHAPKFGSELAGGNFDFILELIREIWIEEGINVTVYEFE